MLQEIFLGEKLQWPKPYRCAVNFVFNYQGAEGLEPDAKGRIDAEESARREYGPRVGIWRILRLLDKYQIKATFVTCGALAERYPDTVKAIHTAGHDVAGHGYHHEKAWKLTQDEELETMRKTVDVLTGLTGKQIDGLEVLFPEPRHSRSGNRTRIYLEQQLVFPRSSIFAKGREQDYRRNAPPTLWRHVRFSRRQDGESRRCTVHMEEIL